jgi:hypothetical protein
MRLDTSLLIHEPPLQVLPSLAQAIGLNEAIILQQIHYLVNSGGGRVIGGDRWVFDTYEELQRKFFPFWSAITLKRTMLKMESHGWLISCQPEGVMSRRKYYRLSASCYINLTSEKYREAIESRRYQNDTMGVSERYVPLTETPSEKSEPKEHTSPPSGADKIDFKAKRKQPTKPTWADVCAECVRLAYPSKSAKHFWLLNEYYGWAIAGRPIRNWKLALASFVKTDATAGQIKDKTTNAEFWAWANETFPDDKDHVNAWVAASAKNGWQKRHKITGELEHISDYRAACTAFVETCRDMNIPTE